MTTRRYLTKPIDPGVEACFGESHRLIFRGDLRIMASKRVRIISVEIEIEEYADEQPTVQPQFLAIVEAKQQPDEGRWLKYALPLVELPPEPEPFAEVRCICGHWRSEHADSLEEPSATDECKLCECLTFEPVSK